MTANAAAIPAAGPAPAFDSDGSSVPVMVRLTLNLSVHAEWEMFLRHRYRMSFQEGVEDLMAFADVVVFADHNRATLKPPFQFRLVLSRELTGFAGVENTARNTCVGLGAHVQTLKIHQLFLEAFSESKHWVDPTLPYGVNKDSHANQIMPGWPRKEQLFPAGVNEKDVREIFACLARQADVDRITQWPMFKKLERSASFAVPSTTHVRINRRVYDGFVRLCQSFQLTPEAAVRVLLDTNLNFLRLAPIESTGSLRADLLVIYHQCREVGDQIINACGILDQNRILTDVLAELLARFGPPVHRGLAPGAALFDPAGGGSPGETDYLESTSSRSNQFVNDSEAATALRELGFL